MSDVTERVRETFATVGQEVAVPPFDEVAFRRRVVGARRRRGLRVGAGVAVAASVAAVAAYAVPGLLDNDGSTGTPQVAAQPPQVDPGALPAPLYYVAGMRLMAATPDGQVHDLGRSESVVGFTAEGVLATDQESRLVWTAASSSGEGDGSYTFGRNDGPVTLPDTGAVQSAALSGDGRWLAWLDLEDVVTIYDLKAGAQTQSIQVGRNAYVSSVSDRGVLVSLNGNLTLFGTAFDVSVPTVQDGYGWVSDTVGDYVVVADRDDVTRMYDVTKVDRTGTAQLVDSVPGTGRLAPYAEAAVSVKGSTVRVWAEGQPTVLAGLEGTPQSAGWLDEDHAVVTTAESGGTSVFVCPVAELSCTRVAFSETDIRLAE